MPESGPGPPSDGDRPGSPVQTHATGVRAFGSSACCSGALARRPPQELPEQRPLVPTIAAASYYWSQFGRACASFTAIRTPSNRLQVCSAFVAPNSGASPAASPSPETPVSAPLGVSAPSSSAKARESKAAPARPISRRPEQPAQPLADAAPSVVYEQIPIVPRSARDTIRGHAKVAVLVIIDRAGDVIDALFEDPGQARISPVSHRSR